MTFSGTNYTSARVTISLKDGRELTHHTGPVHGGADDPPSEQELIYKFNALTHDSLSQETASRVIEMIRTIENIDDITELTYVI